MPGAFANLGLAMLTPKGWTRHAPGTFSADVPASEKPEPIIRRRDNAEKRSKQDPEPPVTPNKQSSNNLGQFSPATSEA